jgi:hypothetical protein
MPPKWSVNLGDQVLNWYWNGSYVHVVSSYKVKYTETHQIVLVTTFNLTAETSENSSYVRIDLGPSTKSFKTWEWSHYDHIEDMKRMDYHRLSDLENPVMLDGGHLAIYRSGLLWLVDVTARDSYRRVLVVEIGVDGFLGLLPSGKDVYLVGHRKEEVICHGAWRMMDVYTVTLIEMETPRTVLIGSCVTVPGLPLKGSSNGLLYTVSTWYLEDRIDAVNALNVVRIGYDNATVLWAIDLTGREFRIFDDRAVISEIRRKELSEGGSSAEVNNETYVFLVDLSSSQLLWVYRLDGGYQLLHVDADVALMCRWRESGLVLIDLRNHSPGGVRFVQISAEIYGISRVGDRVFVPQLTHGTARIDL